MALGHLILPSLHAVVLLALLHSTASHAAAPDSAPAYETYMSEAAELSKAEPADHLGAARGYARAYDAMPPEVRITEIGHYTAQRSAEIYWTILWKRTEDIDHLKEGLALLDAYFADRDHPRSEEGDGNPAEGDLDLLEMRDSMRAELQAELATRKLEQQEMARKLPRPSPPVVTRDAPSPAVHRRTDALALSLLSAGSLVTLGGVALMVDGALFPSMIQEARDRRRAKDEAEGDLKPGDPDPPAYAAHRVEMERRGATIFYVGLGGVVLGSIAAFLGGQRLVRNRRARRLSGLQFGPRLGPRHVTMDMKVHF